MNKAMQTFTFNRPITMLFCLPLLILITMFIYGLTVEFRVSLVVMLLFSMSLVALLAYLGILRRLTLDGSKASWRTPTKHYEMPLSEVKSFGVVKFRSFRFIYISKNATDPFEDPTKPVVTDADTFVIQFRPKAWDVVRTTIAQLHPDLKPNSTTRL